MKIGLFALDVKHIDRLELITVESASVVFEGWIIIVPGKEIIQKSYLKFELGLILYYVLIPALSNCTVY